MKQYEHLELLMTMVNDGYVIVKNIQHLTITYTTILIN